MGREIFQHGLAQQGVGAGLIALTLTAQPSDDVGVKAKRQLLFQRTVEGITDGIFPEFFRQFRNIGSIDAIIGPLQKFLQTAFSARA